MKKLLALAAVIGGAVFVAKRKKSFNPESDAWSKAQTPNADVEVEQSTAARNS